MNIEKSAIKAVLDTITTEHLVIGQQAEQKPNEYNIVDYVRGANIERTVVFTGTLEQCLEFAVNMVAALDSVPHCLEAKRVMTYMLGECDTLAMQDITLYMIDMLNSKLRALDDLLVTTGITGGNKFRAMLVRLWDDSRMMYRPLTVYYKSIDSLEWQLDALGQWKLDITGVHGDNEIGA